MNSIGTALGLLGDEWALIIVRHAPASVPVGAAGRIVSRSAPLQRLRAAAPPNVIADRRRDFVDRRRWSTGVVD